ncbi:MAG: DUF6311 domain-containing protein [Gemmiger sp.]|nr:DUF6311 domain-containing protein [Gemmiger sp.]
MVLPLILPQHGAKNNCISRKKLSAFLMGLAAGAAVFLLLYGTTTLHTGYDGWILNGYDETDIQQHYAGWLLFRNSHWAFPLGLCDTLAVPDGTLISYTDSVPWVSIFFKLLRGVLPATFQWFGWYTLLCFMLGGAAGALLAGRACRWHSVPFAALGGLLFSCSPVLWERAFRHLALGSHYLYLFALYFYLEYRAALLAPAPAPKPRYPWQFALLGFAAVGIHPYFLPPVLLCALLAAIDGGRFGAKWQSGLLGLGGALAATLAGGLLCGAIGGGVSASRTGYGDFSMNLNAPFNPSSRGGYTWSRALGVLPQQPGQYDGFNYLGLGVLVLVGAALAWAALRCCRPAGRKAAAGWWRRNAPLMAGCLFLTAFAVTNQIYWGSAGVQLPLPEFLLSLCGIFRSSGRMFYLVGACATLFGLHTLWAVGGSVAKGRKARVLACLLLGGVLALQGWDLSAVAAQKRAVFVQPVNATVVNDAQTQTLGAGHTKLLAAATLREDRLRLLALLAGKQGLATNISIAVSGQYPGAAASATQAAAALAAGRYDADTVYVTNDEGQYNAWQQTFAGEENIHFFVASSCYFLVPQG